MLSSIKKLLGGEAAVKRKGGAAPEYIFLLDLERKKEYLLDLRSVLRTPGARRALPRLHRLETTVTRNDTRIRIPHDAMPALVRELVSVERRIPAESPLRELMEAVPGLAASMRVDPTPTSVLMGGHETLPGQLTTREMNTAARRVGELLAKGPPATNTPPSTQMKAPATKPPAAKPAPGKIPAPSGPAANGPAASGPATRMAPAKAPAAKAPPAKAPPAKGPPVKPAAAKEAPVKAAPVKAAPAKSAPAPAKPASAPPTTTPGVLAINTTKPAEAVFDDKLMSAAEQQRYLQESNAQLQAAVLRTSELASGDMAAYFDLCLMSGEYEKVVDALLTRVTEEPTAWAWIRLLNAAQAANKMEFEVWCSNFKTWIGREHPALLPDMLAEPGKEDLKFGVQRAGLLELERKELKL